MTERVADETDDAHDASEPGTQFFALKHGDTFLVADPLGDIAGGADGVFRSDTRVLSKYRLLLEGKRPSLLGSGVSRDNVVFTANLTNHPLAPVGAQSTPEGVIHIDRSRFLWDSRLFERITFTNFGDSHVSLPVALIVAADFHDMFEVRGMHRLTRGEALAPEISSQGLLFRYRGLDGVQRSTAFQMSPSPAKLSAAGAEFQVELGPTRTFDIQIEFGADFSDPPSLKRWRAAAARARVAMRKIYRQGASLKSSGNVFDEWLGRSRADLALLTTQLPTGPFPYAGIPWFSTPFGRDAIITALQILWLDPSLARGVLSYLALTQAKDYSAFQNAEPGKIMHETRKGEMTALKELPFGQYYGAVDTTPLFVVLAGAYAERTGDLAFIAQLWPSLEAAIGWVETNMRDSPEGFVTYRPDGKGLVNQGWKDSKDSISHADGALASGPIAVVEVQGYAFGAFQAMSALAGQRGETDACAKWKDQAEKLRAAVEEKFWIEHLGTYALARDGTGKTCDVTSSNPGHLLYIGLPSPERARLVISQMVSPALNSGWGIRTLARGEVRFNPMSYHNGSVWPHDVALCTAGVRRYRNGDDVVRLTAQMFEAAIHFGMRLPELFCGFARRAGQPPIAYPVACMPQAWASGAAFMLLQSCLGLRIDGVRREIHLDRPSLPIGIDSLTVRRLVVGEESIDLVFQRVGERVAAFPRDNATGSIQVLTHA
ncbi:MAG TPA: amylo-alpha-1,6-glucosidase [Rhizomicrobium sp.]|jgi:glycogen debranching enzyme